MPENSYPTNSPNFQNNAGQYVPAQTNIQQPQNNYPGAYPQGGAQTTNIQPYGFCTNCGKQLWTPVRFCPGCGTEIKQAAPPANAPIAMNIPAAQPVSAPIAGSIPTVPPVSAPFVENAPTAPPANAQFAEYAQKEQPEQQVPLIPINFEPLPANSQIDQNRILILPEKTRHNCAVCDQETSGADTFITVTSGIRINIGKGRDKKDLYYKEPTLKHTAPVCGRCNEEGVKKIKKMKPLNCILAILFWPIGIAMLVGGFVLFFSDYLWIPLGSILIKPYIFGVILCIPGILVITLALRFGKRGFSKPEKILILDAEKKLKSRIMSELTRDGAQSVGVFVATTKETANLQKQNTAAQKACKHPVVNPVRPNY